MAVFQFGGLVEQVNSVTAAGGTTTLTNTSKQIQVLNVSGSNGQTYTLPDATTMAKGQKFEFYNTASGLMQINKNGGASLTSVNPVSSIVVKLVDNSTSAGTWVTLANGSASTGGSKNYLSAVTTSQSSTPNTGNGNFESGSTTGWSLAHSALTSNFPSTVGSAGSSFSSAGGSHGGSAASGNLSLSAVSSGQLAGSFSGSYASSAATTAGDMLISDAFNIDTEDQAKVMTFKIYYKAQSGAANGNFSGTSSNSFGIAIYDVTNAAWIMPAGVWGLVQNSGVGYATGTFQTTSNSTQYQIALFNSNASSGAITLYVDDISVGPQTAPSGPVIGDWIAYTPTGSWNTNTNYAGFYRRNGDSLDLQIQVNLTGAPNNVTLTVNLPPGISIDGTKQLAQGDNEMFGTVKGVAGGNGFFGSTQTSGSTAVLPVFVKDGNTASIMTVAGISATTPYTFANADFITITATGIPITGWSSNSVMSADTDTRVVEFSASSTSPTVTGGGTTFVNTFTNLIIPSGGVISDSHSGYNTSTGVYTVPVAGLYSVMFNAEIKIATPANADFAAADIVQAGSSGQSFTDSITVGAYGGSNLTVKCKPAGILKCNAGDTISFQVRAGSTSTRSVGTFDGSTIEIKRLSGPAVVTATESVNARYYASSTSISGSLTTVSWTTKDYDTHNAMSAGTYTIPVSGKYQINTGLAIAGTIALNSNVDLQIQKNGSVISEDLQDAGGAMTNLSSNCSDIISCLAGDTIRVQVSSSATVPSIVSSNSRNFFSIARVGN